MECAVYILYSRKLDRLYAGRSVNPEKRFAQHNNQESGFTATGVPWSMVWIIHKPSLPEAERLERKIKNLSRNRKILFMKKYADGIVDMELLYALS